MSPRFRVTWRLDRSNQVALGLARLVVMRSVVAGDARELIDAATAADLEADLADESGRYAGALVRDTRGDYRAQLGDAP